MPRALAERQVAAAAPLFAALGDQTRLVLLRRLSDRGPASISALAASLEPMTRQGVTKHLNVLADAGVIEGRREGREHIWAVSRSRLDEARRCLDLITRAWDDALGRLKAHIETDEERRDGSVPPSRHASASQSGKTGRSDSRRRGRGP